MSKKCLSSNPLVRDGTSRQQRLLRALLPSYVAVDERSMKDLLKFAFEYGKEIKFYDLESDEEKDWQAFYKLAANDDWERFSAEAFIRQLEQYQEAKPHLALFLGFLYMFREVQADLNTITQRHLDFYYREVLQLEERAPEADQVAVIFQLAKHVHQHNIQAGTLLRAGKDDTGKERIYRVEEDVVINRAQVAELRAVYANIDPEGTADHRIYLSPVANSADGQGKALEGEEKSWSTFGQVIYDEQGKTAQPLAEIGFAVASPVLFLAEGERMIKLNIAFTDTANAPRLKSNDLLLSITGEKGWIVPLFQEEIDDEQTNILTLNAFLGANQSAVIAYNSDLHAEDFDTPWPVLKIRLNPDSDTYTSLLTALKGRTVKTITIQVEVTGVRDLVLQNDQGPLDPSKPFLPFGSRPYIGSNFLIGSTEVFQKDLRQLALHLQWNELPEKELVNGLGDLLAGFDLHYGWGKSGDTNGSTGVVSDLDGNINSGNTLEDEYFRKNQDFQIQVAALDDKAWKMVRPSVFMFTDPEGQPIDNNKSLQGPNLNRTIKIIGPDEENAILSKRNLNATSIKRYSVDTHSGFIQLSLINKDFGHSTFPKLYTERVIAQANGADPEAILPNPPYTPSIQNLTLSYTAQVNFQNIIAEEQHVEHFFHLHPFGIERPHTNHLLPQITNEGQLFIGIRDLAPPQVLSLLITVAEGSANPIATQEGFQWSILTGDRWKAFDDQALLRDGTNGLLQSGIVRLSVPEEATTEHRLMPAGLHWLRVSVQKGTDAVCRLIDIQTQAVTARFQDQANDPEHLRQPLPPETISKLLVSDARIDKILQPYASYGGKAREARADFYTRTSERLRHKQRAITIWDYERLILQEFPDIYKVKCINHTRFTGSLSDDYSEIAPGHVTLVVVPKTQNKNAIDPLRPRVSMAVLAEIRAFVRSFCSPCIQIHVHNPVYEEVQVGCCIKFRAGIDAGYYLQRLNGDIRRFLSPWSSDCGADLHFGGQLHKSVVLNFVEERSYVDYVTCFEIDHISDKGTTMDIEEVVTTSAVSILGSADQHLIKNMDSEKEGCNCENNIRTSTKIKANKDCGCGNTSKTDNQ